MAKVDLNDARQRLAQIPREQIGFFPTPLHRLDNLSKDLGISLYLKRDDLSGPSTFGGNKVRKLEYLLADAKRLGAEYVITYGATQSNHAMLTAIASSRAGLRPVLFLTAVVPPDPKDLRGNLLLDHVLGAEIHILPMQPGMSMADASAARYESAKLRIMELESLGHRCYKIPGGGASPVGCLAFASGYLEMMEQAQREGVDDFDYIVHASGSGGTLAGLTAGRALSGSRAAILSFASGFKGADYASNVADMANKALSLIDCTPLVAPEDIKFDMGYVGQGYECPTDASTDAVRLFARREGVLFDPVYTSKALAGMLEYIDLGTIPKGSKVLFWHTGGVTALFAEAAIVGDVHR
ncbi:MAG: 1-aminocyclopropane-1-carboxylate deaminase/D-cysteine desulfhydrase [Bacillota bacterium]